MKLFINLSSLLLLLAIHSFSFSQTLWQTTEAVDDKMYVSLDFSLLLDSIDRLSAQLESAPLVKTWGNSETLGKKYRTWREAELLQIIDHLDSLIFTCGDNLNHAGYSYRTIEAGGNCWFAENLRTVTFANGDPIPNVTENQAWGDLSITESPAWCQYDNDPAEGAVSGLFYNWYAVDDSRGLCPSSWHVSTDSEWVELAQSLGTDGVNELKSSPVDVIPWDGTNATSFSSIPTGTRWGGGSAAGVYTYPTAAYFFTANAHPNGNAWMRAILPGNDPLFVSAWGKNRGMSVRCVKN